MPYWSEICTKVDESDPEDLKKLYTQFREKAESQILKSAASSTAGGNKSSELNMLNGGLYVDDTNPETSYSNIRVKLNQALKVYQMKFRQMEEKRETLNEMLSFVSHLGMVPLKDLNEHEFELNVRLESLLIETLKEAY